MYGLFVKDASKAVPLTSIRYDVKGQSFATVVHIRQTFKNIENVDLECVYGFPINDQAGITGLMVQIDDRYVT